MRTRGLGFQDTCNLIYNIVRMSKIALHKPVLIMLYGFPGSGKTKFSKNLADTVNIAHLDSENIRSELFSKPQYTKEENKIIRHLMDYMTEKFLNAGASVVYDCNDFSRLSERRDIRDLAKDNHATPILIWMQIDSESALKRAIESGDKKDGAKYSKDKFEKTVQNMQNPQSEDYIVISGKHTFNTQRDAVIKKLYDIGAINAESATTKVVKPGMVNLVPNQAAGRVDLSRRNIFIR